MKMTDEERRKLITEHNRSRMNTPGAIKINGVEIKVYPNDSVEFVSCDNVTDGWMWMKAQEFFKFLKENIK